ncbi:MAG: hypothetical protein M1835_002402 [Candelina submexicana]|nr:MAG: hypothetical protein M1835_002402 [Candelina submexicana]
MPGFFLRAIEHAAQAPSATTIRPIYSLLAGSCNGLLTILPSQSIARFQEQLIKVLKNLENHSVNLLCLATFAIILKSQKEASFPNSESSSWRSSPPFCSPTNTRSVFEPIQQFFGPKRAPKTMQLVMLRVIYTCSGSGTLTSVEALESVRLAKEIMDAIEPSVRDAWLQSNGPLARKMNDKVLRSAIAPDLRLMALDFVSSLLAGSSLPPELISLFQDTIAKKPCSSIEMISLDRLSMGAKFSFLTSIDEGCVTEVLEGALKIAARPELPSNEILMHLKAIESLIRGLAAVIRKSSKIRQSILCAVASNEFLVPLKDFLEIPETNVMATCSDYSTCPAACVDARRRLCLAISTLLLTTALYSSTDNIGIETSLAASLLERQQAFAALSDTCKSRYIHQFEKASGSLKIVEQSSTPSSDRFSHRWRERLGSELSKEVASRNEIILQMVGEVCRDLEDRCETVEQPLNIQKACLEQLTLRNVELEAEAAERGQLLRGLETEKSHLESQVQSAEIHADELSQRCQELEAQVLQACQDIESATNSARDEAKRLELEHIASLSCKDDLLDERSDQIKRVEQEAIDVRADLEFAHSSSNRKDTEIYDLQITEKALRAEVATLRFDLNVTRKAVASLEAKNNETVESSRKALETLSRDHGIKLTEAAEQNARTQLAHQRELHEREQQRRSTAEKNDMERQQYDSRLAGLEGTIVALRSEIRRKTKEFMEVQGLSRRLVAIMGQDSISGTQRTNSTGANGSFDSSTSSQTGSTPKRSKTRKTPKTPSINRSKAGGHIKALKTAGNSSTRNRRIPLKDLDNGALHQNSILVNHDPRDTAANCKVDPKSKVEDENLADQEAMETDGSLFSDSDLLTSTQACSPNRHANKAINDETTDDI